MTPPAPTDGPAEPANGYGGAEDRAAGDRVVGDDVHDPDHDGEVGYGGSSGVENEVLLPPGPPRTVAADGITAVLDEPAADGEITKKNTAVHELRGTGGMTGGRVPASGAGVPGRVGVAGAGRADRLEGDGGDGSSEVGELALSVGTRARIRDGVPASTRRAYAGALARFSTWCERHGRRAVPASPETLAEYVSALADQGLARASTAQAIAAIRTAHRAAGHPGPDTTAANLVLRAATREQTRCGMRARQAPPVTVAVLRAMIEVLDLDTVAGRRDHALLVLGFAAFARRSEIAGWNLEDLVETEHGLEAWIREAKTDTTGEGQRADLPRGAHPDTDPVTVARRWKATLAEHDITTGALLRTVDRHGHLGGRLSGDAVSAIVRRLAVRAGIPRATDYTGHSLRAGAATAAFTAGAPIAGVTRAGRWADGSATVGRYHRGVDRWRDHPLRGVGL